MTEPFDMPPEPAPFEQRGGWVVRALMRDLPPLSAEQAAGIVGNLGYESDGFTKLQEVAPVAGRGGYGWAQWTGSRRLSFEHWCSSWSDPPLNPASDEANYGYLVYELTHMQAYVLPHLRQAKTLVRAVFIFGIYFERPAGTTQNFLPGFADRLTWARRALAGSEEEKTA